MRAFGVVFVSLAAAWDWESVLPAECAKNVAADVIDCFEKKIEAKVACSGLAAGDTSSFKDASLDTTCAEWKTKSGKVMAGTAGFYQVNKGTTNEIVFVAEPYGIDIHSVKPGCVPKVFYKKGPSNKCPASATDLKDEVKVNTGTTVGGLANTYRYTFAKPIPAMNTTAHGSTTGTVDNLYVDIDKCESSGSAITVNYVVEMVYDPHKNPSGASSSFAPMALGVVGLMASAIAM